MDSSVTTATGPSPCTEVVVMSDVSTGGLRLNHAEGVTVESGLIGRERQAPTRQGDSRLTSEPLTQMFTSVLDPRSRQGPSVVQQRAAGAFVGRVRELAELRAGLAQTLDGRGRLYLLSGDPGVGKTRVAGELAAMAAQAGARTLWGRCWEGSGAPAYWPWIQLARTLVRGGDPAAVPTEVARLVEISGPVAVAETAPAPATETARFRLFDSMCGFLADAAADRPLVLLLGDLHWADRPSLLMLQFLARGLADAPVLIAGTYREAEVRGDEERREVVGSILRLARHLPVRGLDVAEAAELIRGHGVAASERIIDRLHETTGGNPFFLGEVVRLLVVENRFADVEQGRVPLPHGVREVVRERLRRLDPATVEVLQVAATLGSQFQLAVMEQVLDLSREQLVEALGRAAVHGVLADTPMTPGGYSFAHGPVLETLYEDIPAAARLQLHLRVGRALERCYGCGVDAHLAELAHHFVRAAPLAPVDAFRYAVRAGRQAVAVLAWGEAAGHFERALSVADLAEVDPRQRCEVLAEVGEAAVQIGARQRARPHLAAARLLARTIAEPELLARVALAVACRGYDAVGSPEEQQERVAVLEEALVELGPGREPLRARLLAQLAEELHRTRSARAAAVSEQAVELARHCANPATMVFALIVRCTVMDGPDELAVRVEVTAEMVRLADEAGDASMAGEAHTVAMGHLLAMGDPAFQEHRDAAMLLSRCSRRPVGSWGHAVLGASKALFEGRFGDADVLARRSLELAMELSNSRTAEISGLGLLAVAMLRGAVEGLDVALVARAAEVSGPLLSALLAAVHAELGNRAEAAAELERIMAVDVPRDVSWLSTMVLTARACAVLGDPAHAATLYRLLEPYAGRFVMLASVVAPLSPVARELGLLAGVLGRIPTAVAHLEVALEISERLGARPLVAQGRVDLARALLARGDPDAGGWASTLAQQAHSAAWEMGMARVVTAAEESLAGTGARAATVPGPSTAVLLRRDGEQWMLRVGGHAARLPDTKGMRYLHYLLRHAGREFHVSDLVAQVEVGGGSPLVRKAAELAQDGVAAGEGGLGPMLDARAKAAYRARLTDLRAELDEAEAWHDGERASRTRAEMDALSRELARSLGLGGRDRDSANPAERARINVTRLLKRAVDAIAAHEAALARHLRTSVRRGGFCSYEPDPDRPVAWTL